MKNKEALGQKVFDICKREANHLINMEVNVRYLCQEIYGIAYMKSTVYQLEKTIKQSIQYAEKIAVKNGEQLLTIKIPVEDGIKKCRVSGWKLQRPGDELHVKDQAHDKFERIKSGATILNNFAVKADEDHLLSEEDKNKIKLPEVRKFITEE